MELNVTKSAITKSIRVLSPDGHLINETEITIVGDTLDECYEKYKLVKADG